MGKVTLHESEMMRPQSFNLILLPSSTALYRDDSSVPCSMLPWVPHIDFCIALMCALFCQSRPLLHVLAVQHLNYLHAKS